MLVNWIRKKALVEWMKKIQVKKILLQWKKTIVKEETIRRKH